ncbi:DUF3850 domain-containing protein [Cedecea davisae]|uniref:DUF3850 domain-containing protein n=1 Tax=Cedecea davisae TaxID=158484 RepID=A0ABS6DB21_9ENTR|nr:DUF3850 domain-containing protein [Cedecea davisae]MBU4680423.1 DUF3850 domain-containing protein [Cedecea davisae]MBU4684915.1 DUF3850 domain-containing protein [Cedecea davisae]
MAKVHSLKIWPAFYEAVLYGYKKAELRKSDRDFNCGDYIVLREWWDNKYSGNKVIVKITHILPVEGMIEGGFDWVVLSISPINSNDTAALIDAVFEEAEDEHSY